MLQSIGKYRIVLNIIYFLMQLQYITIHSMTEISILDPVILI